MATREQELLAQLEEIERLDEPRARRGPRLALIIPLVLGIGASAAAVVVLRRQRQRQSEQSQELMGPHAQLNASQYMNLTTFRKTGEPVPTAVWFAEDGGTYYLATTVDTGKVKRIRRSERALLTPSTRSGEPTGETLPGRARILHDEGDKAIAEAALARKYGLVRSLFYGVMGTVQTVRRKPPVEQVYIAVELMEAA